MRPAMTHMSTSRSSENLSTLRRMTLSPPARPIAVAAKDTAGTSNRLKAADEVAQPLFVEHWLPMQPGAIRVERPAKPKAD